MSVRGFPALPPAPRTPELRRLWDVVAQVRRGKMDVVSEFTLSPGASSSVLTWRNLSPQSVVVFDPKTANAAAELGNGTMYVLASNRGAGAWTVTHANNAQTDRTFQVAVIG